MKALFYWPLIVALLMILAYILELVNPCRSGFFVLSCGMGRLLIYTSVIASLLIYFILSVIYLFRLKYKSGIINWKILTMLGIASVPITGLLIWITQFYIFFFAVDVLSFFENIQSSLEARCLSKDIFSRIFCIKHDIVTFFLESLF